jgi:ABC-2 type transport system permease protein
VLRAYARLLVAQARSQAQYRASFAFDVTGSFLFASADLVAVVVLFRVTRRLGGFDFRTSLLMATAAECGFALADLCVGSIERMRLYVRHGLLDTVLIRPLGTLGQIVVMDFAPRRIGRLLVTGALYVGCLSRADLDATPATVALAVLTPLAGAVLFAAVFVATATVAFWWIDSGEFANAMTYGGREFTAYPLTVFGTGIRTLFGYVVGYAFTGYYPVLTLLGRADPLGLPGWAGWCSPLVALVAAVVAGAVWRIGVRHYRSSGS